MYTSKRDTRVIFIFISVLAISCIRSAFTVERDAVYAEYQKKEKVRVEAIISALDVAKQKSKADIFSMKKMLYSDDKLIQLSGLYGLTMINSYRSQAIFSKFLLSTQSKDKVIRTFIANRSSLIPVNYCALGTYLKYKLEQFKKDPKYFFHDLRYLLDYL